MTSLVTSEEVIRRDNGVSDVQTRGAGVQTLQTLKMTADGGQAADSRLPASRLGYCSTADIPGPMRARVWSQTGQ